MIGLEGILFGKILINYYREMKDALELKLE